MNEKNTNIYLIPGAIVVAGLLIAGAVMFSKSDGNDKSDHIANGPIVRRAEASDHIFGNPEAPVTIVEFSDFQCPFCARIHPTLKQIVEDFDGQVNWVYRHFPLTSRHSEATGAAIASECVARLGGNDAFWDFANTLLVNQNLLGSSLYTQAISDLGIDTKAFESCLALPDVIKRINTDAREGRSSGGRGTPYVVILNENGASIPFSGNLPYPQVRQLVEQVL